MDLKEKNCLIWLSLASVTSELLLVSSLGLNNQVAHSSNHFSRANLFASNKYLSRFLLMLQM